jgi:hypothetical protein
VVQVSLGINVDPIQKLLKAKRTGDVAGVPAWQAPVPPKKENPKTYLQLVL